MRLIGEAFAAVTFAVAALLIIHITLVIVGGMP